jgi:hypothetical protein
VKASSLVSRVRPILDAAHGSLLAGGGDEHCATVPMHRLDNSGGQKRGRRPMGDQPTYKMMYHQNIKQYTNSKNSATNSALIG